MSQKKFNPKLEIKTKRLVLRPYKFSDFPALKRAWSQRLPRQNEFDAQGTPKHLSSRRLFNKWLSDRMKMQKKDMVYVLGIFNGKTGEPLGTIDFVIVTRLRVQCANLGYAVHNHQWRKGYAKEAAKAALGLGFKKLKLHRIEAGIFPKNGASHALAKSIGMKREGVRRRFIHEEGNWRDCVYYVATAEMWGIRKMRPRLFVKTADRL